MSAYEAHVPTHIVIERLHIRYQVITGNPVPLEEFIRMALDSFGEGGFISTVDAVTKMVRRTQGLK